MRRIPILIVFSLVAACNRAPAAQSQTTAASTAPGTAKAATPAAQGAAATTPGQPAGQPAAEPVKPVPATLPDVVARVNGDPCSRGELERAIRNVEQRAGRPVPPEQRDQVFRGVLNELLSFKLVQAEGKARGITVTDQEIDGRIAEIRKQVPTDEAFQQALKQRQMTVADLRNETRLEILVNKTMEAEIAPKVVVTPADLDAFYKQNPDQFKQPEQLRASHILFSVDSSATADFQQEHARSGRRRAEAREGRRRLRRAREAVLEGRLGAAGRRSQLLPSRADGAGLRAGGVRAQARRDQRHRRDRSSASTSSRPPNTSPSASSRSPR